MKYIWFLSLLSFSLIAQTVSEPATPDLGFSHQYKFLGDKTYRFVDTTLNSLESYHQWDFNNKDNFGRVRLGNLGQPFNTLVYNHEPNIWTNYDFFAFKHSRVEKNRRRIYYTRSPLTEASYRMGYDRGQVFRIMHTQNINKFWNAGIGYKRLNSIGNYTNENTVASEFHLYSNYYNPSNGISVTSIFQQTSKELNLNGGIENRGDFENNLFEDQVLIPINLTEATRKSRVRAFYNDFTYQLVGNEKPDNEQDSLSTDSVSVPEPSFAGLAFGHAIQYEGYSETFANDGTSTFFDNAFFTSNAFIDSNAFRTIQNTIYAKGRLGRNSGIRVLGGLRHFYNQYSNADFLIASNGLGITSQVETNIKDFVEVSGGLDYIVSGDLRESLSLHAKAKLTVFKKIGLYGGYYLDSYFPNIKTQFYRSNHFVWQNNFSKTFQNKINYGLRWSEDGNFEINNIFLTDYVYFNQEAIPQQNASLISINQFRLNQNFTFWKFLHLDNSMVYQITVDENNVLPLPDFVTRNALYFEFKLFRKELTCLVGSEVNYFSRYNSPSFNPATSAFFVENKYSIGDYPLINAFANFQLKSARFYLKYEHVNAGFNGYRYYAAPDYALPGRVFLVGIDWRFFN